MNAIEIQDLLRMRGFGGLQKIFLVLLYFLGGPALLPFRSYEAGLFYVLPENVIRKVKP